MKATKLISASLLATLMCSVVSFPVAYATPVPNSSAPVEESLGEHIDDSVITGKVKTALLKEKRLKSLDIHVKTIRGVVYLSGNIPSATERRIALAAAKKVDGVKSVKDEMEAK